MWLRLASGAASIWPVREMVKKQPREIDDKGILDT